MEKSLDTPNFGTEKISKIILKIAPPVMIAQLIQAMYNIVDSFFLGKYSEDALTALSIIYPVQLLITALSVGTGVGVNALMARDYAIGKTKEANYTGGTGIFLVIISWIFLAAGSLIFLPTFARSSAESEQAVQDVITYGTIVCVGSLGTFLESCFSKIHQASGNMKLPMLAQVAGALTNIILDPILIFGLGPFSKMGVAGAAIATVIGQFLAALITGITGARKTPKFNILKKYIRPIYHYAYPSILMQLLYVVYIAALNMILVSFSDAGVTVLGLYYKLQSFFFIPLLALQTCIVPVLSYNYAQESYKRCRQIIKQTLIISGVTMVLGIFCFEVIPDKLIQIFSQSKEVLKIGVPAFRIIGISFLPAVIALISPTFFQAIGESKASTILSLTRQVFCLIPLFWLFSKIGLSYTWIAFPLSETITSTVGIILYCKELKKWKPIKQSQK